MPFRVGPNCFSSLVQHQPENEFNRSHFEGLLEAHVTQCLKMGDRRKPASRLCLSNGRESEEVDAAEKENEKQRQMQRKRQRKIQKEIRKQKRSQKADKIAKTKEAKEVKEEEVVEEVDEYEKLHET